MQRVSFAGLRANEDERTNNRRHSIQLMNVSFSLDVPIEINYTLSMLQSFAETFQCES